MANNHGDRESPKWGYSQGLEKKQKKPSNEANRCGRGLYMVIILGVSKLGHSVLQKKTNLSIFEETKVPTQNLNFQCLVSNYRK